MYKSSEISLSPDYRQIQPSKESRCPGWVSLDKSRNPLINAKKETNFTNAGPCPVDHNDQIKFLEYKTGYDRFQKGHVRST